jgi:hypothetical protein
MFNWGDRDEYNMEDVYVCDDPTHGIELVQDETGAGSILRLPSSTSGDHTESLSKALSHPIDERDVQVEVVDASPVKVDDTPAETEE